MFSPNVTKIHFCYFVLPHNCYYVVIRIGVYDKMFLIYV